MLILTRGPGESIVINGNIEVCVSRVRGNKVSLGITAPKDVPVHRREVQDRDERGRGQQPPRAA